MPEFEPEFWPPLGLYLLMPTFIDREVADREQVVFPAGRPGTLVCLQTEELFRDDPVVITALTAESMAAEPVGTRRGNLWAVRGGAARRQHRLSDGSLRVPYRRWRDIPSRPKPGQRAGTSCVWGRFGPEEPGSPRSSEVAGEPLHPNGAATAGRRLQ